MSQSEINKNNSLKALMEHIPQKGKVTWIGLRPKSRAPLNSVQQVEVNEKGLVGDRYNGSGNRAVTLIQAEHLPVIASIMSLPPIEPSILRRNVVVSGVNLLAFKNKQFKIGNAILEMTGYCHPCSRMEEALGEGGYNTMRGHAGITAKVIKTGTFAVDDTVELYNR